MQYHLAIIVIFNELVEVVKKSKPKKIFTVHGFQKEFAHYLKLIGLDAEPISRLSLKKIKEEKLFENNNKTLDEFF